MFVAGGSLGPPNSYTDYVEVVDLSGDGLVCDDPAPMPVGQGGMINLLKTPGDEYPLVCGGTPFYDECR